MTMGGKAAHTSAIKAPTWQGGLTSSERAPRMNRPAAQPPISGSPKTSPDSGAYFEKASQDTSQENVTTSIVPSLACPECSSQKLWKDGLRYNGFNVVQRHLCRRCGHRFSNPCETRGSKKLEFTRVAELNIKSGSNILTSCRVGAADGAVVNLAETQETRQEYPTREGTTPDQATAKGKIVDFTWRMQKENYSQDTIIVYTESLKWLMKKGANLADSQNVKEVLAKKTCSEARKHVIAAAYSLFLELQGLTWKPPAYNVTRQLPFIPTERELDDLIAACGRKTSVFLQLLKETGMRIGEASKLKWIDVDLQRRIITLNQPEKKGHARIFNVSLKLVGMLNCLQRKTEYAFGTPSKTSRAATYYRERKRISHKLSNPRLMEIGFHTFRHWKATMLYHETKDPLIVKEFLGHRNLDTTLLYIQLEKALFKTDSDEFTVKAVRNAEDIQALLEVGFEYVCQKDGLMFFKKRK